MSSAVFPGRRGNEFGKPHWVLYLDPAIQCLWDLDFLTMFEPVSSSRVKMVVISWSALW